MPREIWKQTKIDGYEVSNLGRVRSIDRYVVCSKNGRKRFAKGCMLKPGLASHGYLTVSLSGKSYCLHELVLLAFRGEKPSDGYLGAHDDGIKSNNVLNNLFWKTFSENGKDVTKHGKRKFTYEQAERIRERRLKGELSEILGREYGCSGRLIRYITNRVQYDPA